MLLSRTRKLALGLPRAGLARVLVPSRSHGDHAYVDAGHFHERETAGLGARDWSTRAFTVGIGGPVGSGKTALMDLLASSCEAGQVRRLHFHELMGHVHAELHRGLSVPAIGAALGTATPLL